MTVHEPTPAENNRDSNVDAPTSLTVSDSKPTPLPKLQIFILFLTLLSEPITGLVIYPFVNQFVRETGVTQGDERKTGYYAGIIVRCNNQFLIHPINLIYRNLYFSWQRALRLYCGALCQIDLGVGQFCFSVHLACQFRCFFSVHRLHMSLL